ncbi:MAG: hypothetical protein WCC25_19075 [Candidatus Korobacteraceae bacterium]
MALAAGRCAAIARIGKANDVSGSQILTHYHFTDWQLSALPALRTFDIVATNVAKATKRNLRAAA